MLVLYGSDDVIQIVTFAKFECESTLMGHVVEAFQSSSVVAKDPMYGNHPKRLAWLVEAISKKLAISFSPFDFF